MFFLPTNETLVGKVWLQETVILDCWIIFELFSVLFWPKLSVGTNIVGVKPLPYEIRSAINKDYGKFFDSASKKGRFEAKKSCIRESSSGVTQFSIVFS